VDIALGRFEVFVLLWSENAARSAWVRAELETALTRRLADNDLRVVPVRLDQTELPPLLRPLKYLSYEDGLASVVDAIMGFSNDRDRLRAIQAVLEKPKLRFATSMGTGHS
jgi:hypothetical protein